MPAEIKQCPFCGGQAVVLYGSGVDLMTQDNRPYVGCPTCHFCIHGETIREALVVWNRRPDTKEIAPSASTNSQSVTALQELLYHHEGGELTKARIVCIVADFEQRLNVGVPALHT